MFGLSVRLVFSFSVFLFVLSVLGWLLRFLCFLWVL